MANRNDRKRNAKRDRAASAAVLEPILYEDPTVGNDDQLEFPVDLLCGCKISQRIRYDNGVVVFFAIIWSKRDSFGGWQEMYSCDSGHGYFHEHVTGHRKQNDRRDVRALYSQVDVQECFDPAYDKVQDRHDKECSG